MEKDDVKVAGENLSRQIQAEAARSYEDKWEQSRENGNFARAQRIGATLACEASSVSFLVFSGDNGEKRAGLCRLLAAFAFVAGIEAGIKDRLLSRIALNVFYNLLKKDDPALYDQINSGGEFTFFYLAYRRGGDPRTDAASHDVAGAFAMLLGREGEDELIAEGAEIFEKYFDFARNLIAGVAFE